MDTSALEAITLEGGPRQRGLQHGEMLRDRIVALLDRWAESLDRVYGISRDLYVQRFFAETAFEAALSRHTPTVLEEIAAIAEGAGVDYRTLLAFQHVNEEFWLALIRKRMTGIVDRRNPTPEPLPGSEAVKAAVSRLT